MCPEVKNSGKKNSTDSVRNRKAALQAKMDSYLKSQKPLEEQSSVYCHGYPPRKIEETHEERAKRMAEANVRLEVYFASNGALDELGGNRTKFGKETEEEKLPEGVGKEDLSRRGVRFMGTDTYSDGRVVYLFTIKEKDEKDWGTVLAVKPANKDLLTALDEKLKERKQKDAV